jgi:ankyrin repeat protein
VLLFCQVDINCAEFSGQTTLLAAIRLWDETTMMLLLENGANASLPDYAGETPLGAAIDVENTFVIEVLCYYV